MAFLALIVQNWNKSGVLGMLILNAFYIFPECFNSNRKFIEHEAFYNVCYFISGYENNMY